MQAPLSRKRTGKNKKKGAGGKAALRLPGARCRSRGHHEHVIEGLGPPLEEAEALAVALELALHVDGQSVGDAGDVHLHRMVDHEVHRNLGRNTSRTPLKGLNVVTGFHPGVCSSVSTFSTWTACSCNQIFPFCTLPSSQLPFTSFKLTWGLMALGSPPSLFMASSWLQGPRRQGHP